METIAIITQVCGCITGLAAVVGLLIYKPIIKPARDAYKKRQEAQEKTSADILDAVNGIHTDISGLTADVTDLQRDRLEQAHDFYCAQGWIDPAKKRSLSDWHERYKKRGNNHLSDHYMQDIESLPEHPAAERKVS